MSDISFSFFVVADFDQEKKYHTINALKHMLMK